MEKCLEKLKHYKTLVDEQKRALDDEIKKSGQYKELLNKGGVGKTFNFSFSTSKTVEELQRLVAQLTFV